MHGRSSKIVPDAISKLQEQKLFRDISEEDLRASFTKVEEIHLLKDELAFRKGERYHKGIYFLLSGKIILSRPNSSVSLVCENEPVGLSSFLGKTMYTVNSVAATDCDLLFVHEVCVYRLMELSDTFRTRLIKDIQVRLTNLDNTMNTFLLRSNFQTVGSCMSSPIITIQTGKSVTDAAKLMKDHKVGSLLVVNRKQIVKGLITARHLVSRFLSELDENINSLEIEKYMDSSPIAFPPEYPIVEALNELQILGASHAIVIKNGKPAGVISVNDITLMLFENSSVYCAHIEGLETIEELKKVFTNIFKVARALAISSRVSRELLSAVSSIHYAIQRKVFQLTSNEFEKKYKFRLSDYTYSYLLLGAGSRKEMDLHPQINNAIILDDEISEETAKMFDKFAKSYTENLIKVGYAPDICEKRAMGLGFSLRVKDWLKEIDAWSGKDRSEHTSCFSCLMDMSTFDGDITLEWTLRNYMLKKIADKPSILTRLMEIYPEVKVPISQFGSFIVEKEGDYEGMFNLKFQALHYLTNMTRLLSVYAGISDMSTVDRIEHLARKKIITEEMATQALTAFDTIVETLVNEQINHAQNGQPITNYLNPMSLSLFYQEKLKRALHFLTIYTSYGINLIKSL